MSDNPSTPFLDLVTPIEWDEFLANSDRKYALMELLVAVVGRARASAVELTEADLTALAQHAWAMLGTDQQVNIPLAVRNALNYGEKQRAEQTRRAEKFRLYKPSEGAKLPPLEFWDTERTIPKINGGSIVVPYGRFGGMKTTLILADTLDAVERGAKVVFAAGEGSHGFLRNRLPAACKARDLPTDAIDDHYRVCCNVPNLNSVEDVDDFILTLSEFAPDIIVLDTLATASPGIDENSAEFGQLLTSNGPVGKIKNAFNAAVLVVHHSGKDIERGTRGHSSLQGNADAIWRIDADKDARKISKFVEKMRDAEDGFTISYSVTEAGFIPVATKMGRDRRGNDNLLAWVEDVLRRHHGEFTSVQLSRLMIASKCPPAADPDHQLPLEIEQERAHLHKRLKNATDDSKFHHLLKRAGNTATAAYLWMGTSPVSVTPDATRPHTNGAFFKDAPNVAD